MDLYIRNAVFLLNSFILFISFHNRVFFRPVLLLEEGNTSERFFARLESRDVKFVRYRVRLRPNLLGWGSYTFRCG